MNPILLSILTPAIPARFQQLESLCARIAGQIGSAPVEHLAFIDNRRRTVGEKRDALLRAARGNYVAFVDDDDDVSEDYIARILEAAAQDPDVITFRQRAIVNGVEGKIEFRLGSENESFKGGGVALRNAWHICAWRRSIAVLSRFPASNYGEDWSFAAPLCAIPNLREQHIDAVLHTYRHDANTTAAPPP